MNIPQQIKKAEKLAKNGQLDSAIELLSMIVKKFPNQAQAHGLLGLLYVFKKNDQLAEQHFLRSIHVDFNIGLVKNFATLLIQGKRWQDAYPWSQRLLQELPQDVDIQLNHATILRNMNQTEGALNIYQQLIKNSPQYIQIYIGYGYTLNQLERYQEAVEVYQQGLKVNPNEFGLLYNLGITYLNQFDYDNSLKHLNLALEQNTQVIDLWLTISVCFAKKRDFRSAFNSIQSAHKVDPNNILVPFQMGTLLLQQGKSSEAMDWLNQVTQKDPENVEANYHKGLLHLREENYKEALPYYRYRVKRLHNRLGKFNDFELPKLSKESEIIVSWEQGIGDEILYLGLINNILPRVKSISYITQDKLYDWVKLNLPDINVIKESESKEFIKHNRNLIQLNAASLMAYIEDWDAYFKKPSIWAVDHNLRSKYLQKYKFNNQTVLGVSWISANKKIGDEKSIPLNQLSSVISNQKTISLQYGDVQDEINKVYQDKALNIIHDDELDYFNDINRLAALISICDIVVTCSNVTAHIAGRLGIKTYLMIPRFFGNIWYWNESQHQSRWYPSVTIIKQKIDMSWDDPIQEVKKQLSFA